jgi:hypothetical protein
MWMSGGLQLNSQTFADQDAASEKARGNGFDPLDVSPRCPQAACGRDRQGNCAAKYCA